MSASSAETKEDEKVADPEPSAKVAKEAAVIVSEAESSKRWRRGNDRLLILEKQERQAEEEPNVMHLCKQILNLCRQSGDWKMTIEYVEIVCRRRSQFRKVIVRTVQTAMEWVDVAGDSAKKLVNALIGVTEGKIFVEVERARLTRIKAQMAEKAGNIAEAANILQELQIETFGSMVKREKCEFLLEQVRLCLAKRDFIRAGIIRNKITSKILKDLKDLEIKYWNLSLIYFYHYERQYLELSKAYRALKDLVTEDKDKVQALANSVMALVLSPYSNEQKDLLHKYLASEVKLLERLPMLKDLLRLLTTDELIEWPFAPAMQERLARFEFTGVVADEQAYEKVLLDRVIQHNIRVICKYYERITTVRLSEFLKVSIDETEKYLSEMVSSGEVYARIDRLDGIISFRKKPSPTEVLNDWRSDVNKLLSLVDQTCHQIHKEMMVQSSKKKKSKR